jgi:S1-C subfamily serine protease
MRDRPLAIPVFLLVVMLAFVHGHAAASESAAAAMSAQPADARVPPAPPGLRGTGTAFAVDAAAHLLASWHVVSGCGALRVRHGNLVATATVSAADAGLDLALLKSRERLEVVPALFRTGSVAEGEGIVVAGFAREVAGSGLLKVVTGKVGGFPFRQEEAGSMRLSVPVDPGSSGGPVLDLSGRVAGVASGRLHRRSPGTLLENPGVAVTAEAFSGFLQRSGVWFIKGRIPIRDPAGLAERAGRMSVLVECH